MRRSLRPAATSVSRLATAGVGVAALAIASVELDGLAYAAPVTSPDEVCAPAADPCIISTAVETDILYPLDFGLRTVRIVAGGKLVGSVDLLCGAFEVDISPDKRWMDVSASDHAIITARRACSVDGTTPCSSDFACSIASLGTCTAGDGGIRIVGSIRGPEGPQIDLRAVGDIDIEGEINAKGGPPSGFGGYVTLDSDLGSIELAAEVNVGGGRDEDYGGPGLAGGLTMNAAGNIAIREPILAQGGTADIDINASGDIYISDEVLADGQTGLATSGGDIEIQAGGDLEIVNVGGKGSTLWNISGGREKSYYGGTYAGRGGYAQFNASGNVTLGENVWIKGDSGASFGKYNDDSPGGSCIYVNAGGELTMNSKITARGRGRLGYGCVVQMYSYGANLGRRASVTTRAMYAGNIRLYSYAGAPVTMDGRLDATAGSRTYYGSFYGTGGYITMNGGDFSMNGRVRTGGGAYGGYFYGFGCRFRLGKRAAVNTGRGRQYSQAGYNTFIIRESMIAERGSRIRTRPDGYNYFVYRDPLKPPVLNGSVNPDPSFSLASGLEGCPVCGNSEIDEDETCDDGNVLPGDGCSDSCQTE